MNVIDLTREISQTVKVFPGSPKPLFIKWSKLDIHGYDSEVMFMSTHTGTHMDAPCHFTQNGKSIDQIDVKRFISRRSRVLRIEKKSNELITRQDILEFRTSIEENDSIIFDTGWEMRYHKSDERKIEDCVMANPGLAPDASQFLVDNKVNAVAIDCPSIDAGMDSNFTSHKILLSNDVLVVENLSNLEKLRREGWFTFIITPLKLAGATGSPVRAIAIID
jgi:kynurenine formamidase